MKKFNHEQHEREEDNLTATNLWFDDTDEREASNKKSVLSVVVLSLFQRKGQPAASW
jgi:hypothetical protein